MKSKNNIIKFSIYLIITIGTTIFVYKYWKEINDLKIQNISLLIPLTILFILFSIISSLINIIIIKEFKINLSFKESFSLSIINTLGNYISPFRGGSISNAIYLKKKYKFSYSSFISMLSGIYIIVFWINTLVGITALIITKIYYNIFSIVIFMVFISCFLTLSIVIIISPKLHKTKYNFVNKFIDVINNWRLIRKNLKTLIQVACLSFINIIIMTCMSYLEFQLIGTNIGIIKLLVMAIFSSFSIFLSITPANLGIREAFSLYSGQLLNIPIAQVLAVSIIDRLISFILSLILGIYFSNKLLNKTYEKE